MSSLPRLSIKIVSWCLQRVLETKITDSVLSDIFSMRLPRTIAKSSAFQTKGSPKQSVQCGLFVSMSMQFLSQTISLGRSALLAWELLVTELAKSHFQRVPFPTDCKMQTFFEWCDFPERPILEHKDSQTDFVARDGSQAPKKSVWPESDRKTKFCTVKSQNVLTNSVMYHDHLWKYSPYQWANLGHIIFYVCPKTESKTWNLFALGVAILSRCETITRPQRLPRLPEKKPWS